MDELYYLAEEIIETINKEDAFDKIKKNGGFVISCKASDIKEGLGENWNIF